MPYLTGKNELGFALGEHLLVVTPPLGRVRPLTRDWGEIPQR